MASDEKDKKIGKIFMGPTATSEATMESLDAMQAASRREQLQQRALSNFEETVKVRAIEKAKLILGQAYEEREKVLTEAREQAQKIRDAALEELAKSKEARAEAERLSDSAKDIENEASRKYEVAHEQGFDAGIEASKAELQAFRAAMGDSVVAVLTAVTGQCFAIFEAWRVELAETTRVCVEKITGQMLNEDRREVLNSLLVEAVLYLDKKRSLILRVNPQDEEAVADIIAAGRERFSGIESWSVRGDDKIEPGGLSIESEYGAVDNRIDVRRSAVENVINNLTIPQSKADEKGLLDVNEVLNAAAMAVAPLAHPEGMVNVDSPVDIPATPEQLHGADDEQLDAGEEFMSEQHEVADGVKPYVELSGKKANSAEDQHGLEVSGEDGVEASQGDLPGPEGQGVEPQIEQSAPAPTPPKQQAPAPVTDPLEALERELLPVPDNDDFGYAGPMREALAEGGFLPPKE